MAQVFNYKGKTYNSAKEFGKALFEEAASDPDNTNLIWEYQDIINATFIDGKMTYPEGGRGKCCYKGHVYEGDIEYKGNKLYVGGEFVKEV